MQLVGAGELQPWCAGHWSVTTALHWPAAMHGIFGSRVKQTLVCDGQLGGGRSYSFAMYMMYKHSRQQPAAVMHMSCDRLHPCLSASCRRQADVRRRLRVRRHVEQRRTARCGHPLQSFRHHLCRHLRARQAAGVGRHILGRALQEVCSRVC